MTKDHLPGMLMPMFFLVINRFPWQLAVLDLMYNYFIAENLIIVTINFSRNKIGRLLIDKIG